MTVAITLDGGQSATETVTISRASSSVSGDQLLQRPITVRLTKSTPRIRYPVTYLRDFNARAEEQVIYTSPLGCNDASSDPSPTCGRAYDAQRQPIRHSEGYCCRCTLCELLGACTPASRASTPCNLNYGASASCLRFSRLWYSAYRIGSAETWYTVTVSMTDGTRATQFTLGPDVIGGADDVFRVRARLVGDFAAFTRPLVLETQLLLVPSSPVDDARVMAPVPQEWMFVDPSDVTYDGSECNHIGLSYNGFAAQGNRCMLSVGSCTGRQIDDLRQEDLVRMSQGKNPVYLARAFGNFSLYSASGGIPTIAYEVRGIQATLITLVFDADNISFTVNVANGVIDTFAVAAFQAGQYGRLSVTARNTGTLAADFTLSVVNCSSRTVLIAAQRHTINPSETSAFTFDVYAGATEGSTESCTAVLFDALNHEVDRRLVSWTVTPQVAVGQPSGGGGGGTTPIFSGISVTPTACQQCAIASIACYAANACVLPLALFLASLVALVVFTFLLCRCARCYRRCGRLCCRLLFYSPRTRRDSSPSTDSSGTSSSLEECESASASSCGSSEDRKD